MVQEGKLAVFGERLEWKTRNIRITTRSLAWGGVRVTLVSFLMMGSLSLGKGGERKRGSASFSGDQLRAV